jgi:superfamily II DNA or RNA helicase
MCKYRSMDAYAEFIERKSQSAAMSGFPPLWMPDFLFDFQRMLVDWALRKGKGAIFADCGLGKTPMQLVWAENVVRKTNKPVLIITPLAVGIQTLAEGAKFGVECERSRDGRHCGRGIVITNYEKLHLFEPADFGGVVCDESSILKHFSGATQKQVTRFMAKHAYRLLCTATAAPNDYHELGTSSEALGALGYSDMLSRFFVQDDKKRSRMNDVKLARGAKGGEHFAKLAYRVAQQIGQWRMKGHAEIAFWRWVCSWAMACRSPADLGFDAGEFILPPIDVRDHIVIPKRPADGMLFTIPAFGLQEERDERRRTLEERAELVARLVDHHEPAIVWCHLNAEGDILEKTIKGSMQVAGANTDEEKEEAYAAFASGQIRVLVVKPKLAAWGMNWQHCAHVVTFASHSYEQYYQSIRRCWRFGQKNKVTVDIISTEGEHHVRESMIRKSEAADKMFTELLTHMHNSQRIVRDVGNKQAEAPNWL